MRSRSTRAWTSSDADALQRQRDAGLEKRLVMFVLDDPEPYILGNEPVYRDGEVVGRITSGFFGPPWKVGGDGVRTR